MDKQESTISNDIIGKRNQIQTFSFPKDERTAAAATNTNRSKRRIAQNFLLIWMDSSIDQTNEDCQNTLTQLRSIVNDINMFTQPDECIQFLKDVHDQKVFLIVSGTLGQHLVPKIHEISQLDTIYIFCGYKVAHEQWVKEWTKVKGVHTEIKSICESLQLATRQCNQDTISMSFVRAEEMISDHNLDQLEPSFMYTKIFKEILLEMEHDETSVQDLVLYCRKPYTDNLRELDILDEFGRTYCSDKSIWWYTRPCFTYHMLNRALYTLDADTIINMGVFIRDLHNQLKQLHQQQVENYNGESFTLYRGQGLTTINFDKLLMTKGGLMSFNNFLSTSKDREVSFDFAEHASEQKDTIGVLFEMAIDPSILATPFAAIDDFSHFKAEEEVLFSMHSVFRIGEITKVDNNSRLYQVKLKLTADDDQQLCTLTDRIREEISDETGWKRLGNLLLTIGQFNKAEELYHTLLEHTSDEDEQMDYYNQLGQVKYNQGDYTKALEYYEDSFKIRKIGLPENHPDLAISYSNIGQVYNDMGDYVKALEYYEKGHEIDKIALPENHPDLAISYSNIGQVYTDMDDYVKALEYYEKGHEIDKIVLPENHPDLAVSYSKIGQAHNAMGDYAKALEYYKKGHEIFQIALPENHPSLATSYSNIGQVYHAMGDYAKALEYFEKAVKIRKIALPENHPNLATSYTNIGQVYNAMGDYAKALEYYEKAIKIRKIVLPENHPNLATSYSKMGQLYTNMGDYTKALSFHQKALNIHDNVRCSPLPCAVIYVSLGETYREMKDYTTALTYLQEGLKIRENKLPKDHPDLAVVYHNIAKLYLATQQYNMAMKNVELALEIAQKKLPRTHPHVVDFKETFEKISKKNES